jgi:ribosomal protein L37AE/L43A
MENEKETCPHCGSTDIEPVHPFDYIKQCNNCGKEFISEYHN